MLHILELFQSYWNLLNVMIKKKNAFFGCFSTAILIKALHNTITSEMFLFWLNKK